MEVFVEKRRVVFFGSLIDVVGEVSVVNGLVFVFLKKGMKDVEPEFVVVDGVAEGV